MDTLDASQARDHIEMVDQILARSERSLRVGSEFFIVWGIVGAAIDSIMQFNVTANGGLIVDNMVKISSGQVPAVAGLWVLPLLIAAAVIFSIVRGRQLRRERCSILQREYLTVLWISLGMAAVVNAGAFLLFPGATSGAIWTVVCAIVLFFIAAHGNRLALVGGIVLVASLVAANFAQNYAGYVLGAGMLIGYAGFGLASLIARD